MTTDRLTTPSQVLFRYIGNLVTVVVAASPACHAEAVSYVASKVDARAALAANAADAAKAAKALAADAAKEALMLRLGAIFSHA